MNRQILSKGGYSLGRRSKPNYDFTIIATGASADLVSKEAVRVYVSDVDETADDFDDLSTPGPDLI